MNMKNFKRVFVLLVSVLAIGCSPSDDIESKEVPASDSFVYSYDNEEVSISSWNAVKVENTLLVTGSAEDGRKFAIEFNKFGNLSSANSYSTTDFGFPLTNSFEYFKSNYFDFELVGIDEVNKRVSVNFSGDLYEDNYDINSTTHFVQGSFNVSYSEQEPQIAGLEVSAKINGKDWYATDGNQSGGFFSGSDIELYMISDDEYFISFAMNHDNTTALEYNFDENSTVNKVAFSEYDPATDEIVEYQTSGTFNITEKNEGLQITQIIGTYNLTARNGSNVIEVTQGKVNLAYFNY